MRIVPTREFLRLITFKTGRIKTNDRKQLILIINKSRYERLSFSEIRTIRKLMQNSEVTFPEVILIIVSKKIEITVKIKSATSG